MPKTCPRCFLTDPADIDACIQRPVLGCPKPVDLKDNKTVVVQCTPCGKLMAVPIGNIMQRRRLTELGNCVQDQCAARVVLPSAKPGKPSPPPISEQVSGGAGK